MATRIVVYAHRPKRPPRKQKAKADPASKAINMTTARTLDEVIE